MSQPLLKQPIVASGGFCDSLWFKFFQSLVPQKATMLLVTVGASPFTYQNGDHVTGFTVAGGTVTQISYSTDGVTFADTGVTAGLFTLQPFDQLRIAHAGAPTCYAGYRVSGGQG